MIALDFCPGLQQETVAASQPMQVCAVDTDCWSEKKGDKPGNYLLEGCLIIIFEILKLVKMRRKSAQLALKVMLLLKTYFFLIPGALFHATSIKHKWRLV